MRLVLLIVLVTAAAPRAQETCAGGAVLTLSGNPPRADWAKELTPLVEAEISGAGLHRCAPQEGEEPAARVTITWLDAKRILVDVSGWSGPVQRRAQRIIAVDEELTPSLLPGAVASVVGDFLLDVRAGAVREPKPPVEPAPPAPPVPVVVAPPQPKPEAEPERPTWIFLARPSVDAYAGSSTLLGVDLSTRRALGKVFAVEASLGGRWAVPWRSGLGSVRASVVQLGASFAWEWASYRSMTLELESGVRGSAVFLDAAPDVGVRGGTASSWLVAPRVGLRVGATLELIAVELRMGLGYVVRGVEVRDSDGTLGALSGVELGIGLGLGRAF